MRKILPYLLGAIVLVAILVIIFRGRGKTEKRVDTIITLSKSDKRPYGTYVMYESLKKFFPGARLKPNKNELYKVNMNPDIDSSELMLIVQPFVSLYDYEINELLEFAEEGNTVFISTFDIGYDFENKLNAVTGNSYTNLFPFGNEGPFDMKETLKTPAFKTDQTFTYPGQVMEGYFFKTDATITRHLGFGNNNKVNFVQMKVGKGNLFLHLSPMSFSNYFLLYKENHRYFEQVFSLVPPKISIITWNEDYESTGRSGSRPQKPNWFTAIMKNPSFRAGILTALLFLLIYTLIEMRRKQRSIPVIDPPKNDSLEFVKTMGLLYYQRNDHQNLAHKMSTYFLEHVRSRYRIFAKELEDAFVKELSYKSGAEASLVQSIIRQIKRVNEGATVSDTELIALQRNIETFYSR